MEVAGQPWASAALSPAEIVPDWVGPKDGMDFQVRHNVVCSTVNRIYTSFQSNTIFAI